MKLETLLRLSGTFLSIKLLQLAIIYFSPLQFDTSSRILLDRYLSHKTIFNETTQYLLDTVLSKFVVWDSVYFMKLSTEGISFEHEWVFGPMWWRLIRSFRLENFYLNLIVSLAISNLCHFLSCILIYYMTLEAFKKDKTVKLNRLAYVCSVLVVLQPSGIFSTANYSESITQLTCYMGIYLRQLSMDYEFSAVKITNPVLYVLSGSLFSIAFGFRSNALLYGILYLDDLWEFNFKQVEQSLLSIVAGLQLFLASIYSIYIPYKEFCPQRGEWCFSYTKSIVSYCQSYYWNNGFLRYFTVGNIPLFLLAAPSLAILLCSVIQFRSHSQISGIAKVTVVYLFVQFTMMHVQIVNRVMTFLPIHIWFVGYLESKHSEAIIKWWFVWIMLQTGLYACYLPPA
ncbi:glycosyltransferase family 76 protein [[Candida] arabinofermentans NRRL YB-2248]|uniref:GPI mannosyltransferase 2 n=1 Tax=[Candida] arabinofermentans NRRL YB-2248 TaxID=983967 RepID=A0A1E4SWS1_9ASCO|nr:glycosyltransferase family 76 protein [[Candida] arabinofermentans NRRL YB-2248]